MLANIDGVIIMSQNSLNYFLYIDFTECHQ